MVNMTLSRKNILVCSGFIAADLLCPTDKRSGRVLLSDFGSAVGKAEIRQCGETGRA